MNIAIIGGGAAGMATAYYLNKNHRVTIIEKHPMLGGNVRTLNKNVPIDSSLVQNNFYIDNGVIEFDESNFVEFHKLMKELNVEMERVELTTAYFAENGKHYFSPYRIKHSVPLWPKRILEFGKLSFCAIDFQLFMLKTSIHDESYYEGKSVSEFFNDHVYYKWLKMLLMYAYSIPYSHVDEIPAALGIPVLRRCALFTRWTRIKGGVYTYIEKILEQFEGNVRLDTEILGVERNGQRVRIVFAKDQTEEFDLVVFATPPDQILKLLSDPSEQESLYFGSWKENIARTVIHTDNSIYDSYKVNSFSAFDVFEKGPSDAGYNGYLNPLVGLQDDSHVRYNLAYNMDDRIDPEKVIHIQEHHTPLYSVDAFKYRAAIIESNGNNRTYHAGAYLFDGLHEGAIRSARAVVHLIDNKN